MWSPNKKSMTKAERAHVERVKESGCAVCGTVGVVHAHDIKQGRWFTSIGLCADCHVGQHGIHGDKTMFRIMKMDEIDALNETLRRCYG